MSPQSINAIIFALNLVLQVTALSLLALTASRFILKRNPALKYAVCLSGLVCVLLSPVAVCIQFQTGYGIARIALPNLPTEHKPIPVESVQQIAAATESIGAGVPEEATPWLSYLAWTIFGLWTTGLMFGGLRLARGWRKAAKMKRGIQPWQAPQYAGILEDAQRTLGLTLPPIYVSPHISMPLAAGVLRPVVILPENIGDTFSEEQILQILLHECAHIKFKHAVSGLLERLVKVLFWPHPLVHALCHELAAAREEVCDNVASQESGAACYARTLLAMAMAQGSLTAPQIASALALLGPETGLEERIIGLLDPRRNRMVQMNRWKLWAVSGTAICALASTAAIRVIAAESKPAAKKDTVKVTTARAQQPKAGDVYRIKLDGQQPKAGDLYRVRLDGHQADLVLVGPDGERLDGPVIEFRTLGDGVFILRDNGESLGSIRVDDKSGNGSVIVLNNLAMKKATEAKQKANTVKSVKLKPGATPDEALAAKLKAEQEVKLTLAKAVKLDRLDAQKATVDEKVLRLVIPTVVTDKADRLK
jgi:beta-lactamase regulating signal transducer with metallopeptidase domain